MKTTPIQASLGYVILFVKDVPHAVSFYERAFGLTQRFIHESNGYAELETGATRLAFVSLELAEIQLKEAPVRTSPNSAPLACEVALVTADVTALYAQALAAGATAFCEPAQKPWGQTVAYVRDLDGHLIELCSPMA
jgi:lactoylglutathione lyase